MLSTDDLDLSRQLEAYLYREDGAVLDLEHEDAMIRFRSTEADVVEVELFTSERIPVEQLADEFEEVEEALETVGESTASFSRSRNFYELTIER